MTWAEAIRSAVDDYVAPDARFRRVRIVWLFVAGIIGGLVELMLVTIFCLMMVGIALGILGVAW